MSSSSGEGSRSCSDFGAIDDLPAYNHVQPPPTARESGHKRDYELQEARGFTQNRFSFKISTRIELDGQQPTLFWSFLDHFY